MITLYQALRRALVNLAVLPDSKDAPRRLTGLVEWTGSVDSKAMAVSVNSDAFLKDVSYENWIVNDHLA